MTTPALATPAPGLRLGPTASLWLTVSLVVSFLAASSAPSPLYALYREAWGFSPLALTVIFSSYAFALLGALLVFGALSDHLGRRTVIVASLLVELLSIVLFWCAESAGWLLAARIVQGFATGIATGALSATLLDLSPSRGALFNSVAPMFGMAVGALGASALVQFAPAPTRLVFDVLLAILALQTLAAAFLPDTVTRRPGVWQSLRPRIAIPPAARATLWRILPLNTASWALGGFYLSLGPTLAKLVTGTPAPLTGGALIATLVLAGAAAIGWVRLRPARAVLTGSALALALGLSLTLVGVHAGSGLAFFGGTLLAGLGFGAGFNGAVRSLVPLAAPHERAGLMAGFFALSYLAFSVPAIVAGLCAGLIGLHATALAYGSLLVAMALAALVASWRAAR
ncbi:MULTISPECIES: MFS transporter [unclassified Rhizobacter]|uniref:MFS transporter n=1 Tax=unclassified Rhizobacter TaxID=2640088 RepID=UPI0006FE4E3E|nr:MULTISPECIES: MFS transporter [unclassified Rhizobacter]KQU67096.1 MFS transporter [Rhizobacter sp. Root29]KQV98193.1 MFS transporter [Rhizobacter sp. Root1238]KRB02091.1 MFS transporter [Rhizobacter sp. Root16D2]